MRKLHTEILYKQVACCASAGRAKEALSFGAARPCAVPAAFELRISKNSRVLYSTAVRERPASRGFWRKTEVEPKSLMVRAELSYTSRTGRIMRAMNMIASKPDRRQSPEKGTPSRSSWNNYVALPGPDSGNAKGAGAQKGNRNARKNGRYTGALRRRHREVRALCDRSREMANLISVMVDAGVNPNAHDALIAAVARRGLAPNRTPEVTGKALRVRFGISPPARCGGSRRRRAGPSRAPTCRDEQRRVAEDAGARSRDR